MPERIHCLARAAAWGLLAQAGQDATAWTHAEARASAGGVEALVVLRAEGKGRPEAPDPAGAVALLLGCVTTAQERAVMESLDSLGEGRRAMMPALLALAEERTGEPQSEGVFKTLLARLVAAGLLDNNLRRRGRPRPGQKSPAGALGYGLTDAGRRVLRLLAG